jgi:periplasmic divalent cation tolerance protein
VTDVVLVFTTIADDGQTDELARALVEERLAACVNVHGPMTSTYRWKGQIECERERQLVMKTTRERVPALEARLRALHAYDVPEFLVLAVEGGSDAYLGWVREQAGIG